ncbi:MAG: GDSL-type esterase/lipase family protein [Minisyncoccia bacterium]
MTNFLSYCVHVLTAQLQIFFKLDSLEKLIFISKIILAIVLFQIIKLIIRLLVNIHVAHKSIPYSSTVVRDQKILILGDSTAYGAGASKPEDTIAGRLAHDFPDSQIINLSKNGALIKDLKEQIKPVQNQVFSMIIISCGGNDVLHFTSIRTIRDTLSSVFRDLEHCAPKQKIIFLLYNNIASAPILPFFMQFFLKHHSKKVQETIQNSAKATQVRVIELFVHEANNPFLEKPKKLFARDGIHPSSRGYELWYNRMWRLLVL